MGLDKYFKNSMLCKDSQNYRPIRSALYLVTCLSMYELITSVTYEKIMIIIWPAVKKCYEDIDFKEKEYEQYSEYILNLIVNDHVFRGYHKFEEGYEGITKLCEFLALFKVPSFFSESNCHLGEYFCFDESVFYIPNCIIRGDYVYVIFCKIDEIVIYKTRLLDIDDKWLPSKINDGAKMLTRITIEHTYRVVTYVDYIVVDMIKQNSDFFNSSHYLFDYRTDKCTEYKNRMFADLDEARKYNLYWYRYDNKVFYFNGQDHFVGSASYSLCKDYKLINKATSIVISPFTEKSVIMSKKIDSMIDNSESLMPFVKLPDYESLLWRLISNRYLYRPFYTLKAYQQVELDLIRSNTPEYSYDNLIKIAKHLYEIDVISLDEVRRVNKLLKLIKDNIDRGESLSEVLLYLEVLASNTTFARCQNKLFSLSFYCYLVSLVKKNPGLYFMNLVKNKIMELSIGPIMSYDRKPYGIHKDSIIGKFCLNKDGEVEVLRIYASEGDVDFYKKRIYSNSYLARLHGYVGSIYYDFGREEGFVIDMNGLQLTDEQMAEIVSKFELGECRYEKDYT